MEKVQWLLERPPSSPQQALTEKILHLRSAVLGAARGRHLKLLEDMLSELQKLPNGVDRWTLHWALATYAHLKLLAPAEQLVSKFPICRTDWVCAPALLQVYANLDMLPEAESSLLLAFYIYISFNISYIELYTSTRNKPASMYSTMIELYERLGKVRKKKKKSNQLNLSPLFSGR